MYPVFKILFNLFVSQFYKLNGGFFLFWFIVFFGIVYPGMLLDYHLMLIQIEIDSTIMLGGVMTAWLLYNERALKCLRTIILKYHCSFLHVLQAVNTKGLLIILGFCHILVFLPVLIYAIIVGGVSVSQFKIIQASLILLFLITIIVTSTIRLKNLFLSRMPLHSPALFGKFSFPKLPIPYIFYLVYYILNERKINILVLKVFSFFFFYLFLIKHVGEFSKSWFVLSLLLICYGHSILLFHVHKFMEEELAFLRNLPLSLFKRMSMYFISISLLFLPELLFMFINGLNVLTFNDIFYSYFILVSQVLLYISLLYWTNIQLKKYLKIIFVIFVFSTFLYNTLSYGLLSLLLFGLSYIIFKLRYYKYEHIVYSN
jgi:hypothetical protein